MNFIVPVWPVPTRVRAMVTTREGGVSKGSYASFNTASHVGDVPAHVAANRALLESEITAPVQWLRQVHGTRVSKVDRIEKAPIEADGVCTSVAGLACAVQTADCLPLLVCNHVGTQIGAIHAGWRGLASGIIVKALQQFNGPASNLYVYLAPAISSKHFEVGEDVYDAFVHSQSITGLTPEQVERAIRPAGYARYYADLYQLARFQLQYLGVSNIYGGEYCTYDDSEKFFSYRRDGVTGRMASLIWLEK